MGRVEYSLIENLIGQDAEILNEGDLLIRSNYTQAFWSLNRGLKVVIEGEDVTKDLDEELEQRLTDHFKEEMVYFENLKEERDNA